MSTSPYPAYRAARSEWLHFVPDHWGEGTLRWLSRRYAGGTPDKARADYWTDGTIPWLNSGSVNQELIREPSAFITEDAFASSSARWVPAGALVMALAGQGKTKGMVAQLGLTSTCNQSMAAIVPNGELDARFLYWWLSSNYQNLRNMAGGDNRDGLNLELLGNVGCPIPPTGEQTAIAAFLDRETGKIDALVEAQRQLIELLKEKRQAVISHAVTKGLDPTVAIKDSGVDWLGKVPGHWEVRRMGDICRELQTGPFGSQLHAKDYVEGGIPVINPSNIKDGLISPDVQLSVGQEKAAELAQHKLKLGDLVLARRGEMGRCAVVRECDAGLLCGTGSIRIRLGDSACPEFVAAFIRTPFTVERLRLSSVGATMDNLNAEIVAGIAILLPPLEEQQAIMLGLAARTRHVDSLIASATSGISLLSERRVALISAAVTGKIDVRGLSPNQAEAA